MKCMACKSIPKWIRIKMNQKRISSDTHRVQDELARIAQTVDRCVAEERVAKKYEIGQSSQPYRSPSSKVDTLSQLFEKSVRIKNKMKIVEEKTTHLSGRMRRLEGQATQD